MLIAIIQNASQNTMPCLSEVSSDHKTRQDIGTYIINDTAMRRPDMQATVLDETLRRRIVPAIGFPTSS